jgi:hypothetical protein
MDCDVAVLGGGPEALHRRDPHLWRRTLRRLEAGRADA